MGLRETLEAAARSPWVYRDEDGRVIDPDGYFVVSVSGSPENKELAASGRLAALAPELASLVLDMGEALRRLIAYEESYEGVTSPDNALLARLDQIGVADETRLGKQQTT
jgi:hypothetical protein